MGISNPPRSTEPIAEHMDMNRELFEQLSKHIASGKPQLSFLRKFMGNETLFREVDGHGNSLLHLFCREAPLDPNVLCLFRAMECSFCLQNVYGLTPLHFMAQNETLTVEALQLVEAEAFVVPSVDGYLPLHHFCMRKPHMDVFECFWKRTNPRGTGVRATNSGTTAAHFLMNNRKAAFVIDMAYHFEDADNEDGPSRRSLQLLRECIEADLATANRFDECPLDGVNRRYIDDAVVLDYVRNCIGGLSPSAHALQRALRASTYLKSGIPADVREELGELLGRMCSEGCTLLALEAALRLGPSKKVLDQLPFVVCNNHVHNEWKSPQHCYIDLLYRYGANPNYLYTSGEHPRRDVNDCDDYEDNFNWGILHECMISLESVCVALLHGTPVNLRNIYNETPLHSAANLDEVDICRLLLKNGADVHAKDDSGCTPMYSAITADALEVVELLLDHGAKVNELNCHGKTPLDLALEMIDLGRFMREDIIELLYRRYFAEKGACACIRRKRNHSLPTECIKQNK